MSYSKIVGEYSAELFRDFPEILHFSNFRVISVPDFRNPNHQALQDAESKPYLHRPYITGGLYARLLRGLLRGLLGGLFARLFAGLSRRLLGWLLRGLL